MTIVKHGPRALGALLGAAALVCTLLAAATVLA